jgi:hypothetical protein
MLLASAVPWEFLRILRKQRLGTTGTDHVRLPPMEEQKHVPGM